MKFGLLLNYPMVLVILEKPLYGLTKFEYLFSVINYFDFSIIKVVLLIIILPKLSFFFFFFLGKQKKEI